MSSKTYHIHIQGIVQGVGFRPYVFRLAEQFLLRGAVCNAADGVHIEFNTEETIAQAFYKKLLENVPILSKITHSSIEKIENKFFENSFKIIHSDEGKKVNLLLTPDFALCEDCKNELKDQQNRRFEYPFTTCTNCGPRYSIIKKLPYDRERTTMDAFIMCLNCTTEYNDVRDRRFYSQTSSCAIDGVTLSHPVNTILQAINTGKIIAIKGIGGYLLMCDATHETAIKTLRQRKHRPTKPFAVMYPNLETLENDAILRGVEKAALQSPEAPIVLLNLKNEIQSDLKAELIAPNLNQIGAMLPYTPLFELILNKINKPLVATSGNISGSPIIFKDEKANEYLSEIADLVVSNNREIVVPQDDSVLKYSFFKEKKIIIRRSRGYAPTYINPKSEIRNPKSALALGAMMKSSFSWAHGGNIYVSQYLGDLESYDTQESFEHTLNHFLHLFEDKPQCIITDKHPDYFSTQLGERLAKEWGIPLSKVQHHRAHFTAVMAENGLLEAEEPILGVIWDGTGLGDDGNIWGGEFFKYENGEFLRAYYFDYFPLILGDKMPKEPRISALSLAYDVVGSDEILNKKFSNTERVLYKKLLKQEGVLQTSSVGRLFDGVASLLDLGDKMSYEGEAAMLLEDLALSFFKKQGLNFYESYISENSSYYRVPTKTLIQNIGFDINKGKNRDLIAAKFHISLVKIIQKVARNVDCKKLAFSGGVFQNSLLVDLIIHHLSCEFDLFFHQQLSPNDENISFGQLFLNQK
jgi:hydrogenase maturation protein HypF